MKRVPLWALSIAWCVLYVLRTWNTGFGLGSVLIALPMLYIWLRRKQWERNAPLASGGTHDPTP